MQLYALLADEDAVSPVIGVILMVAITVILAAVIGTFVLGLGEQVRENPPQASFTFDFNENGGSGNCGTAINGASGSKGTLTITHDGGDKVRASQVTLSTGSGSTTWNDCKASGSDTDITAGDTSKPDVMTEDTLRVVWEASGGGESATLGKWTGPDA